MCGKFVWDGLHWNDDCKVILANNCIVLNTFISWHKIILMALVTMIFYSRQIFIVTVISLPVSQIVLK